MTILYSTRLFTMAAVGFLIGGTAAFAGQANIPSVADTNPDPNVVETTIIADEADIDVNGDGETEHVYAFNGMTPGPAFRVKVGDPRSL